MIGAGQWRLGVCVNFGGVDWYNITGGPAEHAGLA